MRSIQDWEAGIDYPSAQRLQALIAVFLAVGGLTGAFEAAEAEALWAAALRESPRMRTPFDLEWFAELLSERAGSRATPPACGARTGS